MNITSKSFSFKVWEWFLYSSVLERTKSDLSNISWLCGIILLIPIVLVPWGRFMLCLYSYQTYFCFPGSNISLDCGLCDHVITRFASLLVYAHRMQDYTIEDQALKITHDINFGKQGHGRSSYWGRGRRRERQSIEKSLVECFYCHELGHFSMNVQRRENKKSHELISIKSLAINCYFSWHLLILRKHREKTRS